MSDHGHHIQNSSTLDEPAVSSRALSPSTQEGARGRQTQTGPATAMTGANATISEIAGSVVEASTRGLGLATLAERRQDQVSYFVPDRPEAADDMD